LEVSVLELFCFATAGFICEVPWATAGFLFFAFLLASLLTDDLSSSEGVDCLRVLRVDLLALPNTNIASRGQYAGASLVHDFTTFPLANLSRSSMDKSMKVLGVADVMVVW
jgi:hypothetical protein